MDGACKRQLKKIHKTEIINADTAAQQKRSSDTAEIARDADGVDFSVDDVQHSALAVKGDSRSSVVVPIDVAYMTSY